jgi:hypothetical protein
MERKFTGDSMATTSALFLVALKGERGRREPAHDDGKWPFIARVPVVVSHGSYVACSS